MRWVYLQFDGERVWTVGFYDPDGKFHPDSDWKSRLSAAQRTAWLNGASTGQEEPLRKNRV